MRFDGSKLRYLPCLVAVSLLLPWAPLRGGAAQLPAADNTWHVPLVTTPPEVVRVMLDLGRVSAEDLVYDLGSGDGRIVIAAARERGARAVGVDIDEELVALSRRAARRAGVEDRVRFVAADLFEIDLSRATVVTMYLADSLNPLVRPKLFRELAPGTHVVSHHFGMGDWRADTVVEAGEEYERPVYHWRIPAGVGGEWEFTLPAFGDASLRLRQDYDQVEGTLLVDGREVSLDRVQLDGRRIRLGADGDAASGLTWLFDGDIEANHVEGFAVIDDGVRRRRLAWRAERREEDPSGTWTWNPLPDAPEPAGRVRLQRTEGAVWAHVPADEGELPLNDFYLLGASLRLRLEPSSSDGPAWIYTGTVDGDRIVGERRPEGGVPAPWSASRAGS